MQGDKSPNKSLSQATADITTEKSSPQPKTATKKGSLTIEDFTTKYRLGKGAYGDVFLVLKNSDRKVYALKQIQKRKLQKEEKEYQAMVEKELLTNMKHPGIVKLRYSFQDKQSLYFVQEYCQGGEFINFIKANMTKLTEDTKMFYIGQIVNLLQYLHKIGVTHRDLKPENLMLDKRGHLKLIDFGTAEITNCNIIKTEFKEHILKLKQKSDQRANENNQEEEELPPEMHQSESPLRKRRSTFVGTCYYIAPELLQQNYCPPEADLWALGCIIYQMYYLETPFKDSYQFAVFEKIKKAEISFPKHQTITEQAIDLIKRLLVKNPDQRLGSSSSQQYSYKQLKAHPYFKGINIDNIFNMPVPYIPDLYAVEPNEKDKKDLAQTYEVFKGQIEEILKQISAEEKEILKHQIVEEKTFIIYTYALLVLCKEKQLILITSDQIDKRRQILFKKSLENPCKLQSPVKLLIFQEQRVLELRCAKAEEWITAIQAPL